MTKTQKNFRLSVATIEKLNFLGHRYGTDTTALEVAIDRLYRAEREKAMSERLWVVEFNSSNVPSSELIPDYEAEGFDVVTADQFAAVIRADYSELDALVSQYPYCRITGHPSDGRWISEGGDEVYIFDADLLDSEQDLWDALGLNPEDFGGETWDDVDEDVVRDQVPSF